MDIPVTGRYNHGRILLPRLMFLVDEYGDSRIKFANRDAFTTVQALVDRLARCAQSPLEEILGTILSETGYREHLQESETEEDLNRLAR